MRITVMEPTKLYHILSSCYNNTINYDSAWDIYQNVYLLCQENDDATLQYLHDLCAMDKSCRLEWRTNLAEKGFELTPSQVNQYILIVGLALLGVGQ